MKLTASIGVARSCCWFGACADGCASTILRSSATPCSALRLNCNRQWVFDTEHCWIFVCVYFEINLLKDYSPRYHMFYCNCPKSPNLANRLRQLKIMIDHRGKFKIKSLDIEGHLKYPTLSLNQDETHGIHSCCNIALLILLCVIWC